MSEFREMIGLAKDMLPPPVAPATDNKVLDTVVQLMMKQLDASQQETKELRQEMRDMMKSRMEKPEGEGLEAWIDKLDKLAPKLQSLLGLAGEKATEVVHGRRRGFWEDLALQFVPSLAPGMNALMSAGAQALLTPRGTGIGLGAPPPQQQAALPAPANGQPQQQAPPDPLLPLKQRVGGFLGANLSAVQRYFEGYVKGTPSDPDDPDAGAMNGEDFAIWVSQGNPDILKDARSLGSANIIAMFQQTPAIWNAIAPNEAKFREFLDQVLAFAPEEEEEKEEGPVNLTEEKVN